jgi:large subunit ribosomal protein L30
MAESIKVTLVKSFIGRPDKHKKILRSMGLTRMNRSRTYRDTPAIRGQIFKISHMVTTEEM